MSKFIQILGLPVLLGVVVFWSSTSGAGIFHGRCFRCQHTSACQKICRLEPDEKKVSVTCWSYECEDFCVPGKSQLACDRCEMVCEEPPEGDSLCAHPKRMVWKEWLPGCSAKIRTKKKLMKQTVTKKVPTFKWVVEDLCADCEAEVVPPTIPAGTEIPPVPKVAGSVVIPGVAAE